MLFQALYCFQFNYAKTIVFGYEFFIDFASDIRMENDHILLASSYNDTMVKANQL